MTRRMIAFTVLLALAAAPLALAQETSTPISWLAFDKAKSGMTDKLIGMTIKNDGPMYDELMANGTLISWGIAIPIQHRLDDQWNYLQWATMADWGKVGEFQAGFEKLFASRSEEEMKAMQQAYRDAVVGGAHHDWIVRANTYETGSGESAPKYFHIGYYKAKPGMEGAVTELYMKDVKPIYDGLLSDGTVTSFGMFTQELHGEAGWTHVGWYSMADLGAIDAVSQAIEAGLSEEQMANIFSVMDMDTHRDQVLLIVHLGGTIPEE